MMLRKLGVALLAMVVLGAIAANSAFAENDFAEPGSQFYVGGTKLAEGEANKKTLEANQVSEAEAANKLETTIAGTEVDITATKVKCEECFIENTPGKATIHGKLSFSGLKVTKPANCGVKEPITTNLLTATLGMNIAGTKEILKLTPKEVATFTTVELTGEKCSVAGLYKVTGSVFAEAQNATGVFKAIQQLNVSKLIQETAGTKTSLKFGENAAFVTGGLNGNLEGGAEWGAKEK